MGPDRSRGVHGGGRPRGALVAAVLALGLLGPPSVAVATPDAAAPSTAARAALAAVDAAVPLERAVAGDAVADRLLVTWAEGTSAADATAALDRVGLAGVPAAGFSVQVVDVDPAEASAAARGLLDDPDVVEVHPDELWPVRTSRLATEQWGLRNVGQPVLGRVGRRGIDVGVKDVWPVTEGRGSVTVAIIDTGVDVTHPDLAGRLWTDTGPDACPDMPHGRNVRVQDAAPCELFDPDDPSLDFHGTHVAGIVAADRNGAGVIGVAPGVRLMVVKALAGDQGRGSDLIRGFQYAVDNGAHVINASLGLVAPPTSPLVRDLRTTITEARIPVVAAAGNTAPGVFTTVPVYPGAFDLPNVVSVAATDNRGRVPGFSRHATRRPDVVAPGVDILSTFTGDGGQPAYAYLDGTSQAAPMVTGLLALAISHTGLTDGAVLAEALRAGARPLGTLDDTATPSGVSESGLASGPGLFAALEPRLQLGACTGGAPRASLGDVDRRDVHASSIDCLVHRGLVTGFEDGTYRPRDTVTRGQVATVLANLVRAARPLPIPARAPFSDTGGTTHGDAIAGLEALGVVGGFTDGTYRPAEPVTREQFASLLLRTYETLTEGEIRVSTRAPADARGSTHEDRVAAGVQLGFVQGRTDGRFAPRAEVTRGQVASFVRRGVDRLVNDRVVRVEA